MKILRLTTLLDFGGQEKQYISFTEKPDLLTHQYVFAAIGFGGNAEQILKERGFEVHILNRNFAIRNLFNIYALYLFIRKVKPDIIHTAAAEANFHGIIAARIAGVKTIIGEEIGIPNHSSLAQKVFSVLYRLADQVICVSKSVKKHLVKTGEIDVNKGTVVYNPVSFSGAYKSSISAAFTIIYVGRLEKVKNVETLLKAFSKMQNKAVRLDIVGDGREREFLERMAIDLNIRERVSFKGFQKEPAQFIARADLFVLPSYSEGFGIAAVEAMFQKVAVLCSNVGGIPEFVHDNENGWLFNPNDVEDLVSKLNMIILKNKVEIKRIGEQGYQDVKDQFTVKKYIENIENIYEQK